jgi:hypothetical protein
MSTPGTVEHEIVRVRRSVDLDDDLDVDPHVELDVDSTVVLDLDRPVVILEEELADVPSVHVQGRRWGQTSTYRFAAVNLDA